MRNVTITVLSTLAAVTSLASSPRAVAAPAFGHDSGALAGIVQTALDAASIVPNARVEVVSMDRAPSNCTSAADLRAEVPRAVDGSGKVGVKLVGTRSDGEPCQAWVWARVRVFATVGIALRAIRAGEPFAGATTLAERELTAGRAPADSFEGATAERSVGVGQMIEADAVRLPGLRAGETVKVILVAGSLSIEQTGRAVACARNHNCAVLPSGRHVDGTLVNGHLLVEMP